MNALHGVSLLEKYFPAVLNWTSTLSDNIPVEVLTVVLASSMTLLGSLA